MSAKFVLVGVSFLLPIALLLRLFSDQMQGKIEFTERELRGTAYLRPLLELQTILGEPNSVELEKSAAGAWSRLDEAQANHGESLQFTDEGLGKRGRLGLDPRSMRERWEKVRAERVGAGTRGLEADLRRMITHAGDSSNLILDPDLDTYYLMDVTLLALPHLLTELSRVSAAGASSGSASFHSTLVKEETLPRVAASARTAWIEDANFGGTLATLRPRLEEGLVALAKPQKELIAAIESGIGDDRRLAALTSRARWAGLAFWRVAAGELDALLLMRVARLRGERNQAWAACGIAVVVAGLLALYLLRSITQPLGLIVRDLGPESTAMRRSAERLAVDQVRHTLSEEESRELAAEMNQSSILIRRVVVELSSQISGGSSELICRVEGIGRS
ncbi:MAG: hypothetical protein NTV52_25500 [Acidobacteria bacterium]|nr:hypothetical protein [Acidobacteriota bacterium]